MTDVSLLDEYLPSMQLGEGAYWDAATSSLFWVDINGREVHRYGLAERRHRQWSMPTTVSFAYPKDGRFTVCLKDGVYDFDPATESLKPVATLALPVDHRLNDGKLDPKGRLWVGTINAAPEPTETAALYKLEASELVEVEGGYVNANGKAWSPDGRTMYHADTSRGTIWQYDFDVDTGSVSSKRVFVTQDDFHPDGLTVDSEGNVVAAVYGGGRIDVFSYRGDLTHSIDLPVPNPTSCVIGVDGGTLFITSAREGMSEQELASAPLSGKVFQAQVDWL